MSQTSLNIAFVATRIDGLDGVTLEVRKWAEVLARMGHRIHFIGGQMDTPPDRTVVIEEASLDHQGVAELQDRCFSRTDRPTDLSRKIEDLAGTIERRLSAAVDDFGIDLLIAENCLAIPMHVPLGVAVSRHLMRTRMPCIAHHHDFAWERPRFLLNCVQDYLQSAFPPSLDDVLHVCINTLQSRRFCRRTGCPAVVIPNVMDFAAGPPPADETSKSFRESFGLDADRSLLLQPTRVVTRKNIEAAVEVAGRLGRERVQLFISHEEPGEKSDYKDRITEEADRRNVDLTLADGRVSENRSKNEQGRVVFRLSDAYHAADFVTFPSDYEGFGNAFLESVLHRRPLLAQRFEICRTDIEPYGFELVTFDDYPTAETVDAVGSLLSDEDRVEEATDRNYRIAEKYLSFSRLEADFRAMLRDPGPLFRYPRRRRKDGTPPP